ncbi:MAG: hypothetical protein QM777_01550 [Pseudorhodoferax sp.]
MRLIVGAAEAIVMPASYRWIGSNFGREPQGSGGRHPVHGQQVRPGHRRADGGLADRHLVLEV